MITLNIESKKFFFYCQGYYISMIFEQKFTINKSLAKNFD